MTARENGGLVALPDSIDHERPELRHPTRWSVRVRFVWRDLWLGVFVGQWERVHDIVIREPYYPGGVIRIHEQSTYICLVPCFPIVVERRHENEVPYYGK